MDITDIREFCLSLPLCGESTPFDETTLVYKVEDKMFACCDMVDSDWIALKCDPVKAIELRERYEEITTARHFHKAHWNGVNLDGDLPADFIKEMIEESYFLVVKGMTRKKQEVVFGAWNLGFKQQYDRFLESLTL